MNKFLRQKYGLLDGNARNRRITDDMRRALANPIWHYLLFGVVILVIGFLSSNRIISYSLGTGLATTFAYAIAAVGFCLLMGYSGLASLGTGGFIGIGTYSMYYIMGEAKLPFIVALAVAIAVAIVIGVIVGFISLRIEGIYLAILTLGLSEILRQLYVAVKDSLNFNNFKLFGIAIPNRAMIYVITVTLVIVMIITHNLIVSPTGRAMLAMKNSTAAAQAMGISLMKYRLLAFVICTIYASVSGLLLMAATRSAMASNTTGFYAMVTSLNILAAVIIGGTRSIWGALVGTFIMYGLQTVVFNKIPFFQRNPVIITFVSGILVVLVVMFYPGGLAQLLAEIKNGVKKLHKKIREGKYGKDVG